MPKHTRLALTLLVAGLALPAGAEDLALILSNQDYRRQPDLRTERASRRIGAALEDAGFVVVQIQDRALADIAGRLAVLRPRVEEAERLVILVNGHVVSDGDLSWLLAPEADTPSDLTVGANGLPLRPLLAMAGGHPGEAIVAVVAQDREAGVAEGLSPGYVPSAIPQGVTVLTGPAGDLAALFAEDLLAAGRPLTLSLAAYPEVHANGYLPLRASFMPATSSASSPVAATETEEPEPSPEELLARTEADLNLSRDDRRRVQRSLAILGFDPRGIDGLFGRGSRAAIRGWQDDRRLEATGYLDRPQLTQLLDEGDKRAAELEEEARRRQEERDARDAAYWRETGRGEDEAGLRAYLQHYPDGLFSETARARLEAIEEARRPQVPEREQRDWDRVREDDTVLGYRAYLSGYPDGAYREEAERRLEEKLAEEGDANQRREWEAEERRVAGNSVTRKLVENRLTALGLEPGPNDGEFDEDTRRALRRFQDARGLQVTGYVDQQTMVRILFGN